MNARFLHPSARKNDAAAHAAPGATVIPAVPAEPADCCPAKAVVRVSMPTPRRADLLLCGHHYRASRDALAATSAVVRELPGTSSDIAAWIDLDSPVRVASAR